MADILLKPIFDDSNLNRGLEKMRDLAISSQKAFEDYQGSIDKISDATSDKLVKASKDYDKALEDTTKSISENIKLQSDLNTRTKESEGFFGRLATRVKDYATGLSNSAKSQKEAAKNAKDYTDEIKSQTEVFKDNLRGISLSGDGIASLGKSFTSGAKLVGLFTKQLGFIRAALLATGIGAFVVVLGSLVSFLTSTEKGTNAVKVALASVGAVVELITDKVNDFGEAIFDAITNPKQAAEDFFNFLKDVPGLILDNIIVRFQSLGNIIKAAFNLDFKTLAAETVDFVTGVDDSVGKITTSVSGFSEEVKNAVEQGASLERQWISLRRRQIELNVTTSEYRAEIEKLKRDSEDINRPLAERIKLSEAAFSKEKEILDQQIALKKEELALTVRDNALNSDSDKIESLEKIAALQIELNGLVEQSATKQTELQNKVNALLKEQNDIYIDLTTELAARLLEIELDEADPVTRLQRQRAIAIDALIEQREELSNIATQLGKPLDEIQAQFATLIDAVNLEYDKALSEVLKVEELSDLKIDIDPIPTNTNLEKRLVELQKTLTETESIIERSRISDEIANITDQLNSSAPEITLKLAIPSSQEDSAKDRIREIAQNLGDAVSDTFTALGNFVNSPEFQAGLTAFNDVVGAITDGLDLQIDKINEVIDAQDDKIDDLESQLDKEKDLQERGLRNNVEALEAALGEEQQAREDNLSQREALEQKAQNLREAALKVQLASDLASQASALSTTITNTFSSNSTLPFGTGIFIAITQIAAMFAAIKGFKNQVNSLYTGGNVGEAARDSGFISKGGRSDKPGHHQGEAYRVYDSKTGRDVGLEFGGNEFLVNENESINNQDFLNNFNAGKYRGIDIDAVIKSVGNSPSRTSAIIMQGSTSDVSKLENQLKTMAKKLDTLTDVVKHKKTPIPVSKDFKGGIMMVDTEDLKRTNTLPIK